MIIGVKCIISSENMAIGNLPIPFKNRNISKNMNATQQEFLG